jgi:hypothetical protein
MPLKKDLLVLAHDLCACTGLRVDRLARRHADCLHCWFCQSWRIIEPRLHNLKNDRRGGYDSRFEATPESPRPEDTKWESTDGIDDHLVWLDFSSGDDPSSGELGMDD